MINKSVSFCMMLAISGSLFGVERGQALFCKQESKDSKLVTAGLAGTSIVSGGVALLALCVLVMDSSSSASGSSSSNLTPANEAVAAGASLFTDLIVKTIAIPVVLASSLLSWQTGSRVKKRYDRHRLADNKA